MKTPGRSLLLRMILAFWVVSISGIILVAFLARQISGQEFDRFVRKPDYPGLVNLSVNNYAVRKNLENQKGFIKTIIHQLRTNPKLGYMLVDPDGSIVQPLRNTDPNLFGTFFTSESSYSIMINDQFFGRLVFVRPPIRTPDQSQEYLRRINLNLIIGSVFATLLAMLLGWLVARNIIRPVRELNDASKAIARGDLDRKVKITQSDEIGGLGESFNAMSTSLKKSRDVRRQMVADIAHELRNPLSIILGNAEALSDGVLPATPETLGIIYDEAKHLSRLVDDLRTLSLSEAGELSIQRVPARPEDLIQRAANAFTPIAQEKGIRIQIESEPDLPEIRVDVERLGQVISNLLDNSIKHTPADGRIIISASRVGDQVLIKVADNGSGIPAEDLPYIFDRFYRGKQTIERISDGSGLGLAISRALVELHGGQITVTSGSGKGTEFTISIPIE